MSGPASSSAVLASQRLGCETNSVPLAQRIYELAGDAGRLTPMEGLRGLAVLLVFFVHFHALFGGYAENILILRTASHFLGVVGNAGVDLFFVLSGYLIYGALLRNRTSIVKFLWRRVERIYPTFLAVFVLYLGLSALFPDASKLHDYHGMNRLTYIAQRSEEN